MNNPERRQELEALASQFAVDLFKEIQHGDEAHKAWLLEKLKMSPLITKTFFQVEREVWVQLVTLAEQAGMVVELDAFTGIPVRFIRKEEFYR